MSDESQEIPVIEAQPGVGEQLRTARESRGWSTQDAGSRLRLMARQIEAMEAEDFASLGQPVFARGFVRNYAKLLGLDADQLLERISPTKAPSVPVNENLPFAPKPGFWTSPWVLGTVAIIVLFIAVPTGLYLWLNSGEPESAPQGKPVEQNQPVMPPAVEESSTESDSPAVTQADQVQTPPTGQTPSAGAAPVLNAGSLAPAGQPAPQKTTPQPAPVVPVSAAPTTPPAPVQPVAPKPAVATAVSVPGTPAPVAQAARVTQTIQFRFAQPSWVEIRDGAGRIILSGLNPGNTAVEVKGVPPFSLVVGNAQSVEVFYRNQMVDIKPFTEVSVARFTLN